MAVTRRLPGAARPAQIVTVTATTTPLVLTPLGSATAGQNYTLSLPTQAGGQTITQWSINWGDGSTDNLASPANMNYDTHIYQALGDYLVRAYATSSAGIYPAALNVDVQPVQEKTFGSANGSVSAMAGSLSSLAVQPDGSIVALQSGAGGGPIVRFSSAGQPDGTTFDSVSASIPTLSAVAVESVAGVSDIVAAGSGYCVAGFNSDGSLDTSFGGDGIASTCPLGEGQSGLGEGGSAVPSSLLVQANGDIVLVGLEPVSGGNDDLLLVRFTPTGQLDTSFGSGGTEMYALNQAAASCNAVEQAGGKIVAAVGLSSPGSTKVYRFTSAGALDTSFGTSGIFTASSITASPLVALQADGEIDLVGGNGSGSYILEQLAANGGASAEWSKPAATGQAGALAVQPSGRIVVAVEYGRLLDPGRLHQRRHGGLRFRRVGADSRPERFLGGLGVRPTATSSWAGRRGRCLLRRLRGRLRGGGGGRARRDDH